MQILFRVYLLGSIKMSCNFKRDCVGFGALMFFVACILFASIAVGPSSNTGIILHKCTRDPCAISGPVGSRNDIGGILEKCKLKTGLELGVQRGDYSAGILEQWKSCTKYYLVDPWAHQKLYKDTANVDATEQERIKEQAKQNLAKWENKTVFYQLTTVEAAPKFEEASLDFIYIDARHDYCAVKRDIELYWSKVRCGGIMAGHDYMWPGADHRKSGNNWDICENGETHEGGPKRAVDEFVEKHKLNLTVTTDGGGMSPSWIITKE